MVKDTLIKLIEMLESEEKVSFSVTIGGVCEKTRKQIVSMLRAARWSTVSEASPFPGGYIFPKECTYEHVGVTLYKPEKPKSKGGDKK